MSKVGEDDDKEMVSDTEGVWRLGGREMLRSTKAAICVCVVMVVVMGMMVVALMVAKRVVVLTVVLGIVVLVMGVRVSRIRVLEVVGVLLSECWR